MSCRRWHKADRFLEFHEKLLIFESICRRSVFFFLQTHWMLCHKVRRLALLWGVTASNTAELSLWFCKSWRCQFCRYAGCWCGDLTFWEFWQRWLKDFERRLNFCSTLVNLTFYVTRGPTVFWIAIAGLWMRRVARACFCFCGEDQDYECSDENAERQTFQIHFWLIEIFLARNL